MKLHIGCGTIYLKDWVNVDLDTPHTYLAELRPDLVEQFITTDDAYYARHEDKTKDKLRDGPLHQETVCDAFGTFDCLPIRSECITEFLARQCFEHLSISEARQALVAARAVMTYGAVLRIDVPDHEETMRLLIETRDAFYVRHLLGPRNGDRGFHLMSYTRGRLRELVESHGFRFVGEEPNIHFYPAFCLRFEKR